MKPVLAAARQSRVYHISLAHGDSLTTEHVILGDRAHCHRPGFDPGAGIVHVVGGLHTEVVALVSFAHKRRLGLGGVAQPGGPGAADAHFVLHLVVAQAGLLILAGPGDPEAQRRDRWHLDGHGRSTGVLHHVEGLRRLVAGAVGGGDGQGSAEGVVGVEGIGVGAGCGGRGARRACPACAVPGRCTCSVGTRERSQRAAPAPVASGKARPRRPARVSLVTSVTVKI
jgi:hypothetical protein